MSKSYPKLSKSYPTTTKKSEKNLKNPEKSKKNQIFSLFFLWSQCYFCKKSCYHGSFKIKKKNRKKKLKKKGFSFFETFFLKSFLDIYLCPISKLKKKFLIFDSFPLFLPFFCLKKYHLSPENQYFMFFLQNLDF